VPSSLLVDAFAHHIWATERLLDACSALTRDQLSATVPGTYGSILATLRHLVGSDCWYLSFFRDDVSEPAEDSVLTIAELRSIITGNGSAWMELLAREVDPDRDVVEHGEGWDFHAPLSLRLAQVVHHGTDHRSQVCTALTSLGVTPPLIDLWDFGEATDRTRSVDLRAG
jgi:uncharacterized damage-inducible protein DinB